MVSSAARKRLPSNWPDTDGKGLQVSPLNLWRKLQALCCKFGVPVALLRKVWLENLTISGEKLSSDSLPAEQFINGFCAMTEGYSADQIFNCDETGLYFKMLPGHTLASVYNQPDGTKKAKDMVTINACANASGIIKLPLLLIGKGKNPRCFRKLNKEALPVVYRNQKNSWVYTQIFRDWFLNCFIPETKLKLRELGQGEKAILFLDNCAAHPSEEELVSDDGKIIA